MFERRVKLFLAILLLFTTVLAARAFYLQLVQREYWRQQAVVVMTRPELIDTRRGAILDVKGRVIAQDMPCLDACVDYRAIPPTPDPKWVQRIALGRLRNRHGRAYASFDVAERKRMLEEEAVNVNADIRLMWATLGRMGGKTNEEIEDIRQSIVQKVELRQRYIWYWKYQQAVDEHSKRDPLPWYQSWLVDEASDAPDMDNFDVEVAEQLDPHVILRGITTEVVNELGKNASRFPGLSIQPSVHRVYPYGDVGAHVIGRLSLVQDADMKSDAQTGNPLRKYWPNDLVGRAGLEALGEAQLRGTRGRIERVLDGANRVRNEVAPRPGDDVRTTIDIELQRDIQDGFKHITLTDADKTWSDTLAMPGAAVVIDVASGEVRAMVSFPSFDPNTVDDNYRQLVLDDINRPLLNRATQFAAEPGSTVKTIVGMGAITQGAHGIHDTIECTGYLKLDGKQIRFGRCWTMSMFGHGHHDVPYTAPHPTGSLTYADAIERSCNVFFETLADRMGAEGLRFWFSRFGLGARTGIGLLEVDGEIPLDKELPRTAARGFVCFAGIGQGPVLATPIQMANVATTIARNGVWTRPRIVPAGAPTTQPLINRPDREELGIDPAALAAAKLGMSNVVNGPAGTGAMLAGLDAAGKTGSAQAPFLRLPVRDELNRIKRIATTRMVKDKDGVEREETSYRREYIELTPGTHAHPNRQVPWYRGTGATEEKTSHAWYIGFAPVENPKVAFAVFVEYGGGGGATAGQVAKRLLEACKVHGYLPAR